MASTHITTARARDSQTKASLRSQSVAIANQLGNAAATRLTPTMRQMILAEAEHGDWYHGFRDSPRRMANAKQAFDSMQRRGLVGPDARPTPAALAAAKS